MSKLPFLATVAVALVAAVVLFRAWNRPEERLKRVLVDTTPPERMLAVETFAPVATSAPGESVASGGESHLGSVAPAVPPVRAPVLPDDRESPNEMAILGKLHTLAASDPQQSLKLAREAIERFPHSSSAPEFEWNVVKALVNLGNFEGAKDEARIMVRNYPGDDFSIDVERHLLNPQPNP